MFGIGLAASQLSLRPGQAGGSVVFAGEWQGVQPQGALDIPSESSATTSDESAVIEFFSGKPNSQRLLNRVKIFLAPIFLSPIFLSSVFLSPAISQWVAGEARAGFSLGEGKLEAYPTRKY